MSGRSILVVEDEPLISLELSAVFEEGGAKVFPARTVAEAVELVEQNSISAAVLDYGLGGEDLSTLCSRLRTHHIPFMFYTGYDDVQGSHPETVIVQKPACGTTLLNAIADLFVPLTHQAA